MHVGLQQVFQSWGYNPPLSDSEVVDVELQHAVLAEELGFDSVWAVEHHFSDYAFCPDNVVYLANVAARTTRVKVGTGAVIVPWNDPIRVAEKISMLDHLSGGRLLFGMGRGLARIEYDGMGVEMSEARDRFDEGARFILDALETGYARTVGPLFPQSPVEIRPRPRGTFQDRSYGVAMSPDSVLSVADLGLRIVVFMQASVASLAETFETYRARYLETHGVAAPPPLVCQFAYCDTDPQRVEEIGRPHLLGYLQSVIDHYDLGGEHFKSESGYESYAKSAEFYRAKRSGDEKFDRMAQTYLSVNACGTPDELIEQAHRFREAFGTYDLICCFRYAGIPLEDANRSIRAYARDVLPVLQQLSHAEPATSTSK